MMETEYPIKNVSADKVSITIYDAFDTKAKRMVVFSVYDTGFYTLETHDGITYGMIDDTSEEVDEEGSRYVQMLEYLDDSTNVFMYYPQQKRLVIIEELDGIKIEGDNKYYGL